MSSVQPPLSKAIWSSWHMLMKGAIFFVMRIMRFMARSVRLITLMRLLGSVFQA